MRDESERDEREGEESEGGEREGTMVPRLHALGKGHSSRQLLLFDIILYESGKTGSRTNQAASFLTPSGIACQSVVCCLQPDGFELDLSVSGRV